jgi:isopentenyl-diphosphate delta-isomerase
MRNIAITNLDNVRIPGGIDIDTAHKDSRLQCLNAHCWVLSSDGKYVLLQHRSPTLFLYPDKYDISLAGHIEGDEQPLQSMIREAREEGMVNLRERLISTDSPLYLAEDGVYRTEKKFLHNQLVYLYFAILDKNEVHVQPAEKEVGSFEWWDLDTFALRSVNPASQQLVPHPDWYYQIVVKRLYELRRTHAKIDA